MPHTANLLTQLSEVDYAASCENVTRYVEYSEIIRRKDSPHPNDIQRLIFLSGHLGLSRSDLRRDIELAGEAAPDMPPAFRN